MKVQNKAGRREKNPRMLKRIATHTFPPLLRPPHTYKYQDVFWEVIFCLLNCNTSACNTEILHFIQNVYSRCNLQYQWPTPVAQQSLPTDSALILIFASLTHSPRPETKSVFRNRGSCSRISNLTSLSSCNIIF